MTPFPETGRDRTLVIGNLRPDFSRVTAHSEEILPLSEQRGATGPDNALFVQVPFALGTFRVYRRPLGNYRSLPPGREVGLPER